MIKRPQFILDNEERLADAEEIHHGTHKTHHHHPPKGHASRHHRKYDKTAHTITSTTAESTTKIGTAVSDERIITTDGKLDKYDTIPVGTHTTETTDTTETPAMTISTTAKTKKLPRRQKMKETSTNRTEIEEDRPHRRRKVHHHRRNNTLLTNSVHDDVARINANDTNDATSSTQDPTTREKPNYSQYRFTTVPTAVSEITTMLQEVVDASRSSNDFSSDRTTKPITVTESGATVAMTSIPATETSKTSPGASKNTNLDRSRNIPANTMPVTTPTTTPPVRKHSKAQKNRTSGILGPARIDVTILEAPDRKHKQGTNKISI